jgi:hypothetical protein
MQANLLILHPADPRAFVDETMLLDPLREMGFVSQVMDFAGARHYRPGEEFLQLITFLGCSPVVSLGEPGKTGEEFCHLSLGNPAPEPIFVAGANGKAPRCPSCRKPDETWQQALRTGFPADGDHTCPHCGQTAPTETWNWRQSAGFARSFLIVWGIFEGEAVPSQQLLDALETASGGGPWSYFYYRGEPPRL